MEASFLVDINSTNKAIEKLYMVLLGIFVCSCVFFYLMEPLLLLAIPNNSPFFNNLSLVVFAFGGLVLGLMAISRRNRSATLTIYGDSLEIVSESKKTRIVFSDLKRISFIVRTLTLKPYRIEFIYPDFQLTRVRIKTQEDFYELMDKVYTITPVSLEKCISQIESND
ncbi:hypothetical protein [Sabulibacter ruber]|uniref:hypothetical protein n=1 Tax=Sabulibacter ruber TaxID=2811901 RepID=UPI001A95B7DB|nr:hypothetical protein [Sabulibacter ruber]